MLAQILAGLLADDRLVHVCNPRFYESSCITVRLVSDGFLQLLKLRAERPEGNQNYQCWLNWAKSTDNICVISQTPLSFSCAKFLFCLLHSFTSHQESVIVLPSQFCLFSQILLTWFLFYFCAHAGWESFFCSLPGCYSSAGALKYIFTFQLVVQKFTILKSAKRTSHWTRPANAN